MYCFFFYIFGPARHTTSVFGSKETWHWCLLSLNRWSLPVSLRSLQSAYLRYYWNSVMLSNTYNLTTKTAAILVMITRKSSVLLTCLFGNKSETQYLFSVMNAELTPQLWQVKLHLTSRLSSTYSIFTSRRTRYVSFTTFYVGCTSTFDNHVCFITSPRRHVC